MIDSILYWNQVSLDALKADYSSPDPSTSPTPQQPGPTYAARALAIVHLAMHDAYVAIRGAGHARTYLRYAPQTPGTTDPVAAQAAVAAAASLTLIALFNRQKESFLRKHQEFLLLLAGHDPGIAAGLAWGRLVASRMLEERRNDGSDAPNDPYDPSTEPYRHRPDPMNPGQGFLGPLWGRVKPFGINDLNTAISPLPAPSTLPEYATHFAEVYDKGRDQGGTRSAAETTIGLFWAYDGARNIGTPPRLYNQAVRAIVEAKGGVSEDQNARLFAMVNVAMADAGIQSWHEKYKHNLWRPIVGIREADPGWGPTGLGDTQDDTQGDPYWQPLGAPRTNSSGQGPFTPPFPAYPSGHATFGTAALFVVNQLLSLPESFTFELVSDELNGESVGATGIRPRLRRRFTIKDAVKENILSRVFLGVHWEFDGRKGEQIGAEIAAKILAVFPARA
jgi:vanadium chloroperoxidase